MRTAMIRIFAGFFALTWLVLPGFGLTWAGFDPLWSWLCMAWGLAVAVFALAAPGSETRELGGEVVEAQRAL